MFDILENLTKATVAVAVAPVAVAADVVMIPTDATNGGEVFNRTKFVVCGAAKNLNQAIKPKE
ncbi:hypothetical protein [Acinetobacter sp.]|uniref:hypothetical protein n=1 Tax=Acinetobacter sp. TaxID=472 RepID=UPI00388D1AF3